MTRSDRFLIVAGVSLSLATAIAVWLDLRFGWVEPALDFVAHQFYEVPLLARIRRPSQLSLTRWHGLVSLAIAALGLIASPWLNRHVRSCWALVWVGYNLRALIWIIGGNLPLVPGDSCHYLEVATSVYRGEGAVKHYVESFFIDYPRIRAGQGVLDDWATPLDAYLRAAVFRLVGVEPGWSLEATVAVAKACSFVVNLLCLPRSTGSRGGDLGAVLHSARWPS